MSTNHTQNHSLCQWEPDDKVLRTEFNEDNRKIDAALGALASSVSGKASSSALSSLQATVNGLKTSKADKSALDSLKTTVSQHTSTLSGKGNCQIEVTSYTGNGEKTRTHTFSRKPVVFFISGEDQMTIGYGCTLTYNHSSSVHAVGVVWSGNSCTLRSRSTATTNDAYAIANVSGVTYQIIVLYDQST